MSYHGKSPRSALSEGLLASSSPGEIAKWRLAPDMQLQNFGKCNKLLQ